MKIDFYKRKTLKKTQTMIYFYYRVGKLWKLRQKLDNQISN